VTVIDTAIGRERWKADIGSGLSETAGLVFARDGKTVITSRGGVLRFFEAESGRERLGTTEAHQGGVSAVRYTPDGRAVLTAGDDGTVRLWNAATGQQLQVMSPGGRVHLLALSPDGQSLATASEMGDTAVRVWDLATGREKHRWPGHGNLTGAEALAFSPDGKSLLSYGRDLVLEVRDVATGDKQAAVQPRFDLPNTPFPDSLMTRGAFAPGGKFLAVGTIATAYVADLSTGAELLRTSCQALGFTPDGQCLAVAVPGKPKPTELADGRTRFSPSSADGIDILDVTSGRRKTRLQVPPDQVFALAVSPDAQLVAIAQGWNNPMIRVYRMDSGLELEAFPAPAAVTRQSAITFAPDGQSLAAGLEDSTVLIWDLRDPH
jgi:WD40 repeat protein